MSTVKKASDLPTIQQPSSLLGLDASGKLAKTTPQYSTQYLGKKDLNEYVNPGLFSVSIPDMQNIPTGDGDWRWSFVEVMKVGTDIVQRMTSYTESRIAIRYFNTGTSTWNPWKIIAQPIT